MTPSEVQTLSDKLDDALKLLQKLDKAFGIHVELETQAVEVRAATCPKREIFEKLGKDCDAIAATVRTLEQTVVKHHDELITNHDKAIAGLVERDKTRVAWLKGSYVTAAFVVAVLAWILGKTDTIAKVLGP